ncbi:MAG: family 20 glycosylhydrolase [Terracidiphilus sp.]
MRIRCGWAMTAAAWALPVAGVSAFAAQPALMPWPQQIEMKAGALQLEHPPRVTVTGCDGRVTHAVDRFRAQLSAQTGDPYRHQDADGKENPPLAIRCASQGLAVQSMAEDESYTLSVDPAGAKLDAPTPLGAMHGLQTLLQLAEWGAKGWEIPAVEIHDAPRFPWRGLMIDVSRHFMPLDQLERQIDGMAAVKLNVLHMHLSDDQGFRVESKKAPKLQQTASEGMYYTQEQLREMVAYARERGIRVVPEFDVPGHSTCWTVAYPELASDTPATRLVRNQSDQQQPPLDPTNERVYKMLDDVFGEMAAIFPDAYFHIGGDEVDPKYWNKSEHIQAFMKAHELKTADDLQAMFNKRLLAIVTKHGKHMIGWDEILVPELPRETMIQSWRGPKSLAVAAKMGFNAILSAGYYIDLMYPASDHYLTEPLSGDAATLTPEETKHILGGEAAQWAEYIVPENADNRIWPRTAAIAERYWSPASVRDVDSMYARLDRVSTELEFLGLKHRANQERMLTRLAGSAPKELVTTLAGTLEPVKEYERGETQQYDADRPLNQFIDALSPESDAARRANRLAEHVVANPGDKEAVRALRRELESWRDNDAQLKPYMTASWPLESIAVFSPLLSQLGTAGLEALHAIESGRAVGAGQHADQMAALKAAEVHRSMLLMAVTPGVRRLVEAERVR